MTVIVVNGKKKTSKIYFEEKVICVHLVLVHYRNAFMSYSLVRSLPGVIFQ